jgi:cytochrome c-type biogenesis protein CcmH/NrfG
MKTIAKIFAALSAVLAGLLYLVRIREQELEVQRDVEKDKAEELPIAAVVANLEKKVTQDEKTTEAATGDYDRYRASHPIDGDGSGK